MFMTKFDSEYMNSKVEKDIHSYISDDYKIDCKESMIDPEDKYCTFKAVLKKDVDGIECKTIIKLSESENSHMYNKVEIVGDTKWSEESHSYSTSSTSDKDAIFDDKLFTARMKGIADHFNNNQCNYTFPRLSDYIKNKSDKSEEPTIKANINGKEVEVKDLHKENIKAEPDRSKDRTDGLKKASESKARKDWLASKYDPDELEDDLVKLVRYLFNR